MADGEAGEHTYPEGRGPGIHWALDEAWTILDTIRPGVIPDEVRVFLSGMIAGTLMRLRAMPGRAEERLRSRG